MIQTLDATNESDQLAQVYGEVLQIGSLSFKDLSGIEVSRRHIVVREDESEQTLVTKEKVGKAWCEVGDLILYHPYSYQRVRDPITMDFRDDFVIVNDQDVLAIVGNMEEYKKAYKEARDEEDTLIQEQAKNKPVW